MYFTNVFQLKKLGLIDVLGIELQRCSKTSSQNWWNSLHPTCMAQLVGEIKYANPMQEHYSIISFHTF